MYWDWRLIFDEILKCIEFLVNNFKIGIMIGVNLFLDVLMIFVLI